MLNRTDVPLNLMRLALGLLEYRKEGQSVEACHIQSAIDARLKKLGARAAEASPEV